jgi:Uma2 family endonuclease
MTRGAGGTVIAFEPDGIEIPAGIGSLKEFRAWAQTATFPERGRIDWVSGRVEVDMSPEDLNTHGTPKAAIAARLQELVAERALGGVFIDKTRLSCIEADLSAEPDVLVLFFSTLESGKAKLVPKHSGSKDRFVEIEGSADLVVECLSDASVAKDTKRLRSAYHRAGVREYWLVDARGPTVDLQILSHSPAEYQSSSRGEDGFASSGVLGCAVRLIATRKTAGLCLYRLEAR